MRFIIFFTTLLRGLYAYRGFILGSVKREFQSKYRTSTLGAAWSVINPLAMIVVYTVIFSQIMRSRLPGVDSAFGYSIFLCAGVLTWGLFAEITGRTQNVFLEHANLLKKISFPRISLPVIVVLNAGLNFAIIFGLFTIFLIASGNFPGWVYWAVFPILAVQILFAVGLGMILGVLNVFFRDVGQFFNIALQFWFWLTPIIYPADILPERVRALLVLNPMAPLMQAYQGILVLGQWPHWASLLPITLTSLVFCTLGLHLFRKHAGEIVDEL
jgi:lipopolysaccharide transport system permease protein